MATISSLPVRTAVPTGGALLITEPSAPGATTSVFARLAANALGGGTAPAVGTAPGTVAAGDDARIVGAATAASVTLLTATVTLHTATLATKGQANGLAPLDANNKVSAAYLPSPAGATQITIGTTAGTAAAGNDPRIVGAAQSSTLAAVAISGAYADLTGKPAPGTAGTATPLSNATPQPASGPGGPGIGTAAARDDHYHPAAPGVTIRTVTAAGPVTVLASDAGGFIVINKTMGEATPVLLLDGVRVTVKDGKGDAGTNPITLTAPANGSIDGQPTKVMNGPYDAFGLLPYGGGAFGIY